MNVNSVFVVDDDQDFRESLQWLLEGAGYDVIIYESAEAFLEHYQQQPGCLLLDVRMSGMSGLALQQELKRREYVLPVIMITGHGDVPMAVQAMKNDAVDFIEKPFEDTQLLEVIDKTLAGTQQRFAEQNQQQEVLARWNSLSRRETDVARLVVSGSANREIADTLGISIKTVEIHRSRVMTKMEARRLAELVDQVAPIKHLIDLDQ
ncbi:response regulator transcription factor [Pseudomaricurvus alkylphenolicus]|jgi:FixJ family two-component response regulator|uniref:response regulator transcription factor n=1 Tax=Pseudomaricurvus alkylphenolicus TaxID=1306991 RepID=UPI001423B17C|nr:response regulator [Pseudomaricurvus alkylphenolicus]NIB44935.1 response regulator transcription factor [Pseudomaricurvus alkylphenolicus]